MNVFELTRALVDIDSVTPNEEQVGVYLFDYLSRAGGANRRTRRAHGSRAASLQRPRHWDQPVVTLSTHMDTVPPFFASREDDEFIWGRGACDTKGIIASMIFAVEALLAEGVRGSRCCSSSARSATARAPWRRPRQSARQPLSDQWRAHREQAGAGIARARCGMRSSARGRMAHSAYPHLGESAIEKLLDALERVRRMQLPHDPLLGASTLNIGTIQGGRAPNVIPDHAKAEIFFRLVDSTAIAYARGDGAGGRRVWRKRVRSCAFPRCTWARSTDSKPPWSLSPPIFPPSAERGAGRFCSGRAAFMSRTPTKSACRKRN